VASTIKIKRSGVLNKTPTTSDIDTGELAINYKDQKLYSSNGTAVFQIGGSGGLVSTTTKTFDALKGSDTVITDVTAAVSTNYLQVANATSLLAAKASWTSLTSTNTAIRTLVSDRLQVANASTLYATKASPTTSGVLAHTGRATISTNLAVSGNTSVTGQVFLGTGSAASPSLSVTGDTNTGLFFPAADTIAFVEGGAEAMRIDSSGNLGIGTASPGAKLDVNGTIRGNGNISTADGSVFGWGSFSSYVGGSSTTNVVNILTNSVERMRIDSSGRVTMPYQPYAQGSSGNGYTLASGGFVNGFDIIYNNVDYNVGSHYNNTNGRFTAPVAGVYLVCYTALISTSSSSSVDYRLSISINGNQSQTFSSTKSTGWPTVGGSQMVYLNASDYVAAKFWNDSGSGIMHADANYNRFSITLMS
jgi:hypothetical protein